MLEKIKEKRTAELTAEDFKTLKNFWIMNGCGGCNRGFFQKIILKILTPIFFEASCDLHDFGYWKGWNEARRLECDQKFYEKILEDIEIFYTPPTSGDWNNFEIFLRKNFHKILAKIFYCAVRIGGKKYFNYK